MIDCYEITGHDGPRPDAERILFCDGTGGPMYRPETDLELSHWRPNCTPAEYRAGTSTEICFRFLDAPRPGNWIAAVNNHTDVDGILSVYALVHSQHALQHRETIVAAAEMGDFWGWGAPPAQRLFQGLTWLMQQQDRPQAIYEEAFRRIPRLIDGSDAQTAEIEASLEPLRTGADRVDRGDIVREAIDARFTHYLVPLEIAGDDDGRAAYVPEFNEAISDHAIFWPQARARSDADRVCLVSTERRGGWFHDLWFPGWLWADTSGLWRPPGLEYHDGMSSYALQHPALIAAFRNLQAREPAAGAWGLGGTELPFGKELQAKFPLVGRFLNSAGEPAVSRTPPDAVAQQLRGLFG